MPSPVAPRTTWGSSAISAAATPKPFPPGKSRLRRSTAPGCRRASPTASTTSPTRTASRGRSTRRSPSPIRPSSPPKSPRTKRCTRWRRAAAPRGGGAECRIARGEPALARREFDRIRVVRGQLPDPVAEAEDLRILALALIIENQLPRAEKSLREVIGRAELHERLLLQGEAT